MWGVKIKLNDLSPQHLLMAFNGSRCCHRGYLTTPKSKHNYRWWQSQQHSETDAWRPKTFYSFFFLPLNFMPLNYNLLADLWGCWSSERRDIWASDRVVFTQKLLHLFPAAAGEGGVVSHRRGSQGHLWLTDFSWLYNVTRPWTSISSFFQTIDPTK